MISFRKPFRLVAASVTAMATLLVVAGCSLNPSPPGLTVPVPSPAATSPRAPIVPPIHTPTPEATYGGDFYDRGTVMSAVTVEADERRWQITAFDMIEGDALKAISPAVNEEVVPSTNLYALVFDIQWVETAATPTPFRPSYDFDIVAVGENGKKYPTSSNDVTLSGANDFQLLGMDAGGTANNVVAVASTGADEVTITHWLAVNNDGTEFRIDLR